MQTHLGSTTTKTTHFRTGGEKLMKGIKIEKLKKSHTGYFTTKVYVGR
jgi:hypothetical protein